MSQQIQPVNLYSSFLNFLTPRATASVQAAQGHVATIFLVLTGKPIMFLGLERASLGPSGTHMARRALLTSVVISYRCFRRLLQNNVASARPDYMYLANANLSMSWAITQFASIPKEVSANSFVRCWYTYGLRRHQPLTTRLQLN